MNVQIQLFAAARDAVGESLVDVELSGAATVADLRARLVNLAPALGPLQASLLFAVNHEYATDDRRLHDTDTVACFPPVSGG